MRKIPTLFVRDPENMSRVLNEVRCGCEWVQEGRGYASRKFDGTACLYYDGRLWKRYTWKQGNCPDEFMSSLEYETSAETPGWIPVGDGPGDTYYREALSVEVDSRGLSLVEGHTFELCGPKVQGNPECFSRHLLVAHGAYPFLYDPPRSFDGILDFFRHTPEGQMIEGIVWCQFFEHRTKFAKIKAKDFGLKRKPWKES